MKEYNIKRHYCTKRAAKFDGIKGQLEFDKIELFKKSLSLHEIFNAYETTLSLLKTELWDIRSNCRKKKSLQ